MLQPIGSESTRVIMPYSALRSLGCGAKVFPCRVDPSSDEGIVLLWMLQCGWRLDWRSDAERRFADIGLFLRPDTMQADCLLHGMITTVVVEYSDVTEMQ